MTNDRRCLCLHPLTARILVLLPQSSTFGNTGYSKRSLGALGAAQVPARLGVVFVLGTGEHL